MNKLALSLVLLATTAIPALAADSIGVFSDAAGSNCEVSDPGGNAMVPIYIVHSILNGSWVGSAWKLEWDAEMTMTYVSENTGYFKIGNAKDGAQIGYFSCQNGTILIDTVTMMSAGTSAPCSHITLGPEPTRGLIQIYCNFAELPFVPGEAVVNPDLSCHCNLSATEPSTWGHVKGLYR